MISLTLPNGVSVQIEPADVLRIRHEVPDLYAGCNTRIDTTKIFRVIENASAVADMVRPFLPTMRELKLPGGQPVWFNAKMAEGPVYMGPLERARGNISGFRFGKDLTYVGSSAQEVADAIASAGGQPGPILPDGFMTTVVQTFKNWMTPMNDWDKPPTQ
ncbi:hypothetical protein [Rhizobium herbae]|uniref:DUF3846 domain-containing protein n=1 Tax=Rhizobium herbae TaxID=508661 RepID=A0ABS4EK50_9HYPH|nr:hypothetical protein [Rhizobium herbae]MBP1858315.1 hypothetical protein [Rhizobium herbae]